MMPKDITENGDERESKTEMEEASASARGDTETPQPDREKEPTKGHSMKRTIISVWGAIKTFLKVLLLIYLFMCGIDLLTASFKLIGGKNINSLTKQGTLSNPLVGLMVGVLVTIMVQSSSTSTAIIVSLVSSGVINIQQTIPIIMGSNIGTSVTNTFVSFTQVNDRETFRRAFAGATVHDMFNWLTVCSLLSIEIITRSIPGSRGLLEYTTETIINATYSGKASTSSEPSGLKEIIEPVTSKIIQMNLKILECWARNESQDVTTIIDRFCDSADHMNHTIVINTTVNDQCPTKDPSGVVPCCFLFAGSSLSDLEIGIIMLICSLTLLIACLVTLVKVMNSVLQGPVQEVVEKYINSDLSCCPYLTGYFALIIGGIMTLVMQSSSIFTSLLTPLIGMGVVSIERCYPLTLGSNLGTTTTALLAAFTENSRNAIQIALVHLFFNLFGILLFYPIPFMRFPIPMAKALGRITGQYRWFSIAYLILLFAVMPGILLLLSNAGVVAFWSVMGIVFMVLFFVVAVNILQNKQSSLLPNFLRTWDFLPSPLRSLKPYDRCISSIMSCRRKKMDLSSTNDLKSVVTSPSLRTISSLDSGIDNPNIKENSERL